MHGFWDDKRKHNRKDYWREYSRRRYHAKHPKARTNDPCSAHAVMGRPLSHPVPPPELLADRDRRAAYVPTITESICGDPPPGQSARDKILKAKGLWP